MVDTKLLFSLRTDGQLLQELFLMKDWEMCHSICVHGVIVQREN